MEKITSFTIDHLRLLPGVYVSRKDHAGDAVVTTFDIRVTRPNYEPSRIRFSTSAPWAAAPGSIFF